MYIAEDNLDIAQSFLIAVEESLEQLAEFPLLGKQREFQDNKLRNIRMWHVTGYENFLIFYAVAETTVEVIRVLHGARDIEDLFR